MLSLHQAQIQSTFTVYVTGIVPSNRLRMPATAAALPVGWVLIETTTGAYLALFLSYFCFYYYIFVFFLSASNRSRVVLFTRPVHNNMLRYPTRKLANKLL